MRAASVSCAASVKGRMAAAQIISNPAHPGKCMESNSRSGALGHEPCASQSHPPANRDSMAFFTRNTTMIPFNERHPRPFLAEWIPHYNREDRIPRSALDLPTDRQLVAQRRLGIDSHRRIVWWPARISAGLHHHYQSIDRPYAIHLSRRMTPSPLGEAILPASIWDSPSC